MTMFVKICSLVVLLATLQGEQVIIKLVYNIQCLVTRIPETKLASQLVIVCQIEQEKLHE